MVLVKHDKRIACRESTIDRSTYVRTYVQASHSQASHTVQFSCQTNKQLMACSREEVYLVERSQPINTAPPPIYHLIPILPFQSYHLSPHLIRTAREIRFLHQQKVASSFVIEPKRTELVTRSPAPALAFILVV